MTNSSLPPDCSVTYSDTIQVSGSDTITLTTFDTDIIDISAYYPVTEFINNGGGTIDSGWLSPTTITGLSSSFTIPTGTTISTGLDDLDTSTFSVNLPQDWVNQFPGWDRIQKMCEEYPGLKIAFEKFKTTYQLVKDHYDTPADQRPRP
jgi:hypothetical protein